MKIIIVYLTVLIPILSFSQTDNFTIRQTEFVTKKSIVKNDFDRKDTLLKIYRKENGEDKYLLTFYLYRRGEDCNNSYDDIGKMNIQGDSIIFTSRYLQKGNDPIPESRKRIFVVKDNGKLVLIYDKEKYKNSD